MKKQLKQRILIIDDEPEICWIIKKVLSEKGFDVFNAFNGEQGIEQVAEVDPDLVFLDIKLPGIDGLEVLRQVKEKHPTLPVIILSAFDDVNAAVRAMKLGAYDYLSKPLNVDEMQITLKNALKTRQLMIEIKDLKKKIKNKEQENMVWSCPGMQKVMDLVERIARYDVTVLICGESGTGKELIAESIHNQSLRSEQPLISIDCSALPENLVESELFGYEKGAFTGANESRPGRFEMAHGGTLFLDEIGNLSIQIQMKMLRVLQERKLRRLGGKHEIEIDVRLITATNTKLEKAMQGNQFREDLYHRLNEITIQLPPLRERQEDIRLMLQHFLERFSRQFNKSVHTIAPDALEFLQSYSWPGNIRELMNVMKRAVVMANDTIEFTHLPMESFQKTRPPANISMQPLTSVNHSIRPLKELCQEVARKVERETISRVLQETRWNKVKTARLLKINYKTLFNKMRELGI
ncbi:sigma-54-dependent Fis family transcriptional regulator [bacterium]|nr:sigma-54-dependent Fis family transcriptional regulator [bacterium]